MRFVGVDLAWGATRWTGVAVVEEDGRLTQMGRVRTDDDIVRSVAPHLHAPALVAVDAPLVVTNATGRRSCETLVSRLFGRFHAGAHSSNLSLPAFRDGSRGARLAATLGLDVDPRFPPRVPVRRAIEVYPHPATVVLFGLDRVLPYKEKPGRTPASRRDAMRDLMTGIAALAAATPALDVAGCPKWVAAVHDVASAQTHAELNRWEDAIDAVLCAYIGLHRWWHGDDESAVLGDVETGYIVVPVDDRIRTGLASVGRVDDPDGARTGSPHTDARTGSPEPPDNGTATQEDSMPNVALGRLAFVDPREVWPHEAHDFTPWLLENADALAEVLGIDLELTANEHPVGGFALDLLGKDLTNDCVLIVENQLAGTDHSHLGQILTYAAGTDAATVVWVATSFREEHRQALDWLNNLAGDNARFFGLEIGAVRIGESAVAPLFTLKAQPNDWHAQVTAAAKTTAQTSGKGLLYRAFWARFLERVKVERPGWTKARIPTNVNWMTMPSVLKGAVIGVNFTQHEQIRTEVYIDTVDGDANSRIFEALRVRRDEIEARFGGELTWEELPARRACRIAAYAPGDVARTDQHDAYIDWFLDAGTRLRAAFEPYVAVTEAAAQGAVQTG